MTIAVVHARVQCTGVCLAIYHVVMPIGGGESVIACTDASAIIMWTAKLQPYDKWQAASSAHHAHQRTYVWTQRGVCTEHWSVLTRPAVM